MISRALLSAFAVAGFLGGCAGVETRVRSVPEPTLRPGTPTPLPLTIVLEKVEILDLDARDTEKASQQTLPFGVEGSLRSSYTDALLEGLAGSGAFVRAVSRDSMAFLGQGAAEDTAGSPPPAAGAAGEKAAETPDAGTAAKAAATAAEAPAAGSSPAAQPPAKDAGAAAESPAEPPAEAKAEKAPRTAAERLLEAAEKAQKEQGANAETPAEPAAEEPDPFDLHLHARVFTLIKGLPPEEIAAGTAVANTAAWFLFMFPGWFISDHTYAPAARVALEIRRSGSSTGARAPGFDTGRTDLNFIDRAGVGEYFLQIIAPCSLIPSNKETARETILAEARKAVAQQTEAYFKGRFAVDQARGGEPFLLPLACRSPERRGSFLFLPGEITSLELDDGRPAPGATAAGGFASYVATCRQKQTLKTEALEDLEAHLATLAPEEKVPSAPELDGKYPYVYLFADIGPGPSERRIRVTHKKAEGEDPAPASWTLPRLASRTTETSRD